MNYAPINAQCDDPSWPQPNTQSIVDALEGGKVFTSLDLKAGYHNIPMHPDDIPYTTFVMQDGAYQYLRMTFGFKAAPAHFQKVVWVTCRREGEH